MIQMEIAKCMRHIKSFHPGCVKLHKIYNENNELMLCDGKIENIKIGVKSKKLSN